MKFSSVPGNRAENRLLRVGKRANRPPQEKRNYEEKYKESD